MKYGAAIAEEKQKQLKENRHFDVRQFIAGLLDSAALILANETRKRITECTLRAF